MGRGWEIRMKMIGRKIYIHWDDHIIALEKYPLSRGIDPEALKMTDDEKISIFDIVDVLGEKVERFVGYPDTLPECQRKSHPFTVNEFLTMDSCWATKEEFTDLSIQEMIEDRKEYPELKKEYDLKYMDTVSDDLYKEISETCPPLKILSPEKDESFWGFLFRNEDVRTHKNADTETPILFICGNDTLCGCVCGRVYRAKFDMNSYSYVLEK